MIIRELYLKNFGKFSGKYFQFQDGINVIYGANEAGKTTIYHAIGAMLFGMERKKGRAAKNDVYSTYQPWENKTWYEGTLKFETGGKIFCIERNFYQNERSVHLFCETDGEELCAEQGDLSMLLGETGEELFYNTAAAGQLKMKPQEVVYDYLNNYITGLMESGQYATDVTKAIELLENKKKAVERQKKLKRQEIEQQISQNENKMDLVEEDIGKFQKQLLQLEDQKPQREFIKEKKKISFFAKILQWLRRLFGREKQSQKEEAKNSYEKQRIQYEEKKQMIQGFLGEKESQREELLLEKEKFYGMLHELSKDQEIKAIDLAMERIRVLSAGQKDEVMERLQKKASEVLGLMTHEKYEKLFFGENGEPEVWDGSHRRKLFQVSTGCADQVYLSVRIALQDLFFEDETMPLMFDDAFVYFDDDRLERLLGYLSGLDRQVLLFTCHKRELFLLQKLQISCGKITI